MIRTLLIVTGFGTAIALICLTAAASLAGQDITKNGFSWTVAEDGNLVSVKKNVKVEPEPSVTKTLTWSGNDVLTITAPVDVVYTQGSEASVSVTGPQSLTERLRLEDGKLYLVDGPGVKKVISLKLGSDGIEAHGSNDDFKVTITAPTVKQFEVAGSGRLDILAYDQPSLDLRISGAGRAEATGRTDKLLLNISGMGDANLEALTVTDAEVSISGTGDAEIAPTGKASVNVSGMGDVTLKTKPASLSTNISGAGSVEQE